MKLLAWDTSSKAGAIVALEWMADEAKTFSDVKVVAEFSLNVDLTHSERLLWAIHQSLESAHWSLSDIDIFGVGTGPGSFTGLRIGLTTARTLAHSLNKPVVGVSSLAALARPVALQHPSALIVAVTDACKGELFALWGKGRSVAAYTGLSDEPTEVNEQVITPENLIAELEKELRQTGAHWISVGEGRTRYLENRSSLSCFEEISKNGVFDDTVRGKFLGQLVWEAFQQGKAVEALGLLPQYLRMPDAEIKLKSGLLNRP